MKTVLPLLVVALVLVLSSTAHAQYTLRFDPEVAEGEVDDMVDVAVMLDSDTGGDIQGYQWGVCHDDTIISITDDDIVNGTHTDDDDGTAGAAVTFTFEAVVVSDDGGWTVGALLNVITGDVLTPDDDQEMYVCSYTIDEDDASDLEFCETLGSPAVTVRVIVDSEEIEPDQETGSAGVAVGGGFTFAISDFAGEFDMDTGAIDDFDLTMTILDEDSPTRDTEGFQCGLTYDSDILNLEEVVAAGALDDLDPAFFGANLDPDGVPAGLGGMTLGVVYDLMGDDTLAFDDEEDVVALTFSADSDALAGTDAAETTVDFDSTLGDPVIDNSCVVDGDTVPADFLVSGEVTLTGVVVSIDGAFIFAMDSTKVEYNDDGIVADAIEIVVSIQENDANDGFPNETEGFQMGLTYDPDLLELSEVDSVGDVLDLNDGDGPSFFGSNFDPDGVAAGDAGYTLGVVYSLTGAETINYEDEKDVLNLTFDENSDTLADEDSELSTEILWDDDLGAPVLPNVVVVDLTNQDADISDSGLVEFNPGDDMGVPYINGDALNDEVINNLDAFFIIHFLFLDGDPADCFDAADADDDGEISNEDTLLILNWVYLEGPAPADPFPDCDFPDDATGQDCEESTCF